MVTTMTVSHYIDVHVTRQSQLWGDPPETFRNVLQGSTKSSQFRLYGTLAMFFRNGRNQDAMRTYQQQAIALARDLFDDCDTSTTLESAIGFSVLAYTLQHENYHQAVHYVRLLLLAILTRNQAKLIPLFCLSFSRAVCLLANFAEQDCPSTV